MYDHVWKFFSCCLFNSLYNLMCSDQKGNQYIVNRPHVTISMLELCLDLETIFSNFNNHSIRKGIQPLLNLEATI